MTCAWCGSPMGYLHGHAACLDGICPMFGVNQAECCDGETATTSPAPTASIARFGRPRSFPVSSLDGVLDDTQ